MIGWSRISRTFTSFAVIEMSIRAMSIFMVIGI